MTASSMDTIDGILQTRKDAFAGKSLSDCLVHCRAGVGRTGTIMAAEVMQNLGLPMLETVVNLRDSRSRVMVQAADQATLLADWAEARGHKFHASSEAGAVGGVGAEESDEEGSSL